VYRDEAERDKILSDQSMGIVTPMRPRKISAAAMGAMGGYGMGMQQVKKPLSPYMCFLKE